MRKNLVRTYGILAILFVVFTVVVFAVPFVKNAVFWVSYLFVMLAIGVQGYAIHTAFSKEEPVTSKLYGFPVARIGFIYLVAQTISSVIFMVLAVILPLWVAIVVSIVALGAAGVGLITTDAMRAMQSKTRMLIGQCGDATLIPELRKLSETMQYSDPVSNEVLQAIEFELSQLIDEVQKAVVDQEYDAARLLVNRVMDTLIERNRVCKLKK